MTQWFWGKSERPHSQEGSWDFTAQITLGWKVLFIKELVAKLKTFDLVQLLKFCWTCPIHLDLDEIKHGSPVLLSAWSRKPTTPASMPKPSWMLYECLFPRLYANVTSV